MVFCAEELSTARQPFVKNINVGVNHSPKQPGWLQQKPGSVLTDKGRMTQKWLGLPLQF